MPKNPETKTLSLEFKFSTPQMIHISIFTSISAIYAWKFLFGYFYQLHFVKGIIALIIFLFLLLLTISKKGLVKDTHQLYTGIFIFNTLVFKKRVDLRNKTCFSILKFRKSQKYAFFSAAKPDAAHSFNTFDIYLLNEKHTEKDMLISLKKEKNSTLASDFISSFKDYRYEIYSPDFS